MDLIKKVLPQNAITAKQAHSWVDQWKNLKKIETKELEAFDIPVKDLMNLLRAGRDKEKFIAKIRGKLGYDGQMFKLILVALDENEHEIIDSSVIDNLDGIEIVYDVNYDFTKPCPPYIP